MLNYFVSYGICVLRSEGRNSYKSVYLMRLNMQYMEKNCSGTCRYPHPIKHPWPFKFVIIYTVIKMCIFFKDKFDWSKQEQLFLDSSDSMKCLSFKQAKVIMEESFSLWKLSFDFSLHVLSLVLCLGFVIEILTITPTTIPQPSTAHPLPLTPQSVLGP